MSTLLGLGATYAVHSGLIGKRVVNFMLAIHVIKLFRYMLRLGRYERKSIDKVGVCERKGSVWPKFQVQVTVRRNK